MRLILSTAISAVAIWFATLILGGFNVVGGDDETWKRLAVFAGLGLILGILNTLIKPVLLILSLPVLILTLGLFLVVINAAILWLVSWITSGLDWGLLINNFGTALLAALIISLATFALNIMTLGKAKR